MLDPTRTRRRLLVAMFVTGFAVLGLELGSGLVVDEEFVQERLSERLGGDSVRVSLDDVSFSLLARRIDVSGIVVGRPGVASLSAERIVASGLPLLALAAGYDTPEVGRVAVSRPFVFVHPPGVEPDAQGASAKADTGSSRAAPVVRVGQLRIEDGTLLAWHPDAATGPLRVLVRDVEVDGRELGFDAGGRSTGPRDGLAWRTGAFTRVRADGLVRLAWDSMRASVPDSAFHLAGVRYGPTLSDTAFFRRLEDREDRVRITSPRISARGFDFSLRPDGGFVARTLAFDSTEIDVYSNRRIPDTDTTPSTPWLPHDLVRSFDGRLGVDTVEVSGRIVYRELPRREVTEPGRFVFDDLNGRITGISNAPGAPPMVVEATMTVLGTPAAIRLELPLDVDRMLMRMDGTVGALDLSRLNDLTVPLQGVEIQAGRLEGLRFDVTVDGPSAGGTVWVAYRDLDVQMVDSGTGDGGLLDDIKSFVANTFVLRSENMPDEEDGDGAVPGTVEYYVEPDDPFFTRVWAPIRSGLMDVVK